MTHKIHGSLKNSFTKISARKILLLAMAFCLPVPAQAMRALGARMSPILARVGKQAAATLKQPHAFAQAAIRNGIAKPRFNAANFGKTALATGGLAATLASTGGANHALAQEGDAKRLITGVRISDLRATIEYSSGEKREYDLTDHEQAKQCWLECYKHAPKSIGFIEICTNPAWVQSWQAELHQEKEARLLETLQLLRQQQEKDRQMEERCRREREFAAIPGIVKKMVDCSQAEKEERDRLLSINNTVFFTRSGITLEPGAINALPYRVAAVMGVGGVLIIAGGLGRYFSSVPIISPQPQMPVLQQGRGQDWATAGRGYRLGDASAMGRPQHQQPQIVSAGQDQNPKVASQEIPKRASSRPEASPQSTPNSSAEAYNPNMMD